MSVPRQKKPFREISGNAAPFSEQKGTAIIQAQTAKIEKLFSLRNEVYAINPSAISKKDIEKIAQYSLGLCGLSIEERKAVIFANEPIVKKQPANYVGGEDSKNYDEETALQSIRHGKWRLIYGEGGDPHNAFALYHWHSPFPKVKLLAMLYSFETNLDGLFRINYNVISGQYKLGDLTDSSESATRIFYSALALEIINSKSKDLKKENVMDKDFDFIIALNQCERRIDPKRDQLGDDAEVHMTLRYFQEMYSRLDSIREQAQKILES